MENWHFIVRQSETPFDLKRVSFETMKHYYYHDNKSFQFSLKTEQNIKYNAFDDNCAKI